VDYIMAENLLDQDQQKQSAKDAHVSSLKSSTGISFEQSYIDPEKTSSDLLKHINAFRDLSRESLLAYSRLIVRVHFAPGDTIIREGDEGDSMFILIGGVVRVQASNQEDDQEKSVKLKPGGIFGEMTLLTGSPRSANVIADTECVCLKLKKVDVDNLISDEPKFASLLTSILSERLNSHGGIKQVGKYRLMGELGRGAMSVVYEAWHPTLSCPVAIKMLPHEYLHYPDYKEKFHKEGTILAKLRHPNIANVIDTEEAYGTYFIIMEKLKGKTLEEYSRKNGLPDVDQCVSIIINVAKAISEAHRHGIIHRDLKLSNVMIDENNEIKLTDFGIALLPGDQLKKIENIEGTPNYMAPEQILNQTIDARTDIYALGMMGYKLFTGKSPFTGNLKDILDSQVHQKSPTPGSTRSGSTPVFDQFVLKATEKDPNNRFQTAQEVIDFFDRTAEVKVENINVSTISFVYGDGEILKVAKLVDMISETCKKHDIKAIF